MSKERGWIIKDILHKDTGRLFRLTSIRDRVIAARKMVTLPSGRYLVLGSQGQLYVNFEHRRRRMHGWPGHDEVITPGRTGLSLAKGLLQLELITQEAYDRYSKLCAAASQDREMQRNARELKDAAEAIGLKLTAEQRKKLNAIVDKGRKKDE